MTTIAEEYSPTETRPLKGYAIAMGIYSAAVGAAGLIGKARGVKLPQRIEPYDVILTGVATHKLARIISKDAVTSPLRAPFMRYKEPAGDAELNEDVRADGVGHAFGELLSCPFCLAVWASTSFVGGLVFKPRQTRLALTTFTAVAMSDSLQLVYDLLKKQNA